MNNEQRGRIVYREYTPERELYESRGLTKEEYIIRRFEEETGRKFDPTQFEIIEDNNAFDDGYDNPISTLYVLRRARTIEQPPQPPFEPNPPHVPGEPTDRPGIDGIPGDGPQKPEGHTPGGIDIPGFIPIPGGGRGPHEPEEPGKEPGKGPHEPEKPGKKPGESEPEPHKPGHTPDDGKGPHEPEKPEKEPGKGPHEPEEPGKKPGEGEPEPHKPEPNKPEGHKPGEEPTKDPQPPTPPIPPVPPREPIGQNPPGPNPNPPTPKPPTPQVPQHTFGTEEEEREKELLVQDMLDKYYGNPQKRKEYIERFKRFKKHIVDKSFIYVDQSGVQRTGTCKTVDTTYPEYYEDAQFLQLQEYGFRLERLSRAEQGDFSLYQQSVTEYRQARRLEGIQPEATEDLIQILREEDSEYLYTYNYTYNTHRATRENLKTLGKHGEKVSYIPMSKEEGAKAKLGNVARALANVGIFVRNYTTAPLSRGVGKFIVRPIHELLFDPENQPAGMYRSKRTHRYEARKTYYEDLYLDALAELNAQRAADGKNPKKINGLTLAFKPRFQAIINYREGNIAILNAGAHDIEESYDAVQQERKQRTNQRNWLCLQIQQTANKMYELRNIVEKNNGRLPASDIAQVISEISKLEARIYELQEQIRLLDFSGKSIDQTDAISLAVHDKANKENMTKVVTGVKTAVRIGVMKYIGPRIRKHITDRIEQTVEVPSEQVVPGEHQVIPGHWEEHTVAVPKTKIKDIKIGDIVDGDGNTVTRSALGGRTTKVKDNFYLRGIAFEGDGLSGADAAGFDLSIIEHGKTIVRAKSELTVTAEDSVFDLYAKLSNDIRGTNFTGQDIIDKISSAADPAAELKRMFGRTKLWVSNNPTGVPTGWKTVTDIVLDLATEEEIVNEVVREWIDEQIIDTPEKVVQVIETVTKYLEITREVTDWRYATLEGLALAGGLVDVNELLRRTREKAEVIGEKKVDFPQKNQQKPKHSNVPYHQRDNKGKHGKRQYGYKKYNFQGTKHGDRHYSGYNEAGMGTPGDSVGHSRGR